MATRSTTVSERVIEEVATTINSDALELPRLYDAVDPDALDALVERMSDGEISFTYAGQVVTVDSAGTVDVEDPAPRSTTGETVLGDD